MRKSFLRRSFLFLSGFMFLSFGLTQDISNTPEADVDDFVSIPGTSYCASKFAGNYTGALACLSCLQNGSIYMGDSCVMLQQLCADAYPVLDDQAVCNEKYIGCTDDGGSPDRCSCKAIGGISLNTNVPFIGNCISLRASSSSNTSEVTPTTAFPLLIAGLTKLVMTVILIFCFMAIIVGGVLISMGGASEEQAKKGKDLIKHVVIALALLGASGVILRVINPSFFS